MLVNVSGVLYTEQVITLWNKNIFQVIFRKSEKSVRGEVYGGENPKEFGEKEAGDNSYL